MNNEVWQQLLSLESRDIVQQWYMQINHKELNTRRAKEVNSASKQAREYFRNASNSSYSVKPLLSFYGVSCLSRALILLLRNNSGEEGLANGHGLTTIDWASVLSGDLSMGLSSLEKLKVQTCTGLFYEFIKETKNRVSIHINSSNVDWKINYRIPPIGEIISLGELFSRIPDLETDYMSINEEQKYTYVNELNYSVESGFEAKVNDKQMESFKSIYEKLGYEIVSSENQYVIKCNPAVFNKNSPLFIHKYIEKTFLSIPTLYLAEPFQDKGRYSQLCITYMVSYFLGMLVRYYPTHWVSLIQGEKGDLLWPLINRAQQFVEKTFPELVIELIHELLKESKN